MAAGIKKRYETLRKQHKLPAFDELDAEFEISTIETEQFLLRQVRRKMAERIGEIACRIEEVMQPDTNLVSMYESRVFSELEKKELFELYKKLMVADRQCVQLLIQNDDKLDADFIKAFLGQWKKTKPDLLKFFQKLQDSWQNETEDSETAGYMG